MQGWLDVLEARCGGLAGTRKTWTRRFLALNATFRTLEVFADDSQQHRVARIDLGGGAIVATADELGEALHSDSRRFLGASGSQLSVENSRRFVFRVTEAGSDGRKPHQHYLCADVGPDVASSRECLGQWLRALRPVIGAASPSRSAATMDMRDLSAQMAAFAERLHLSATVVARRKPSESPAQYELLVKAWVLARELVDDSDGHSPGRQSWQVLEYSCEWRVGRSTAQLRDLDAHLRQFAGRELRDVVFPSVGTPATHVVSRLLHAGGGASADADAQRRVTLYDAYLQGVLRLPSLSMVGSDAGAVLDTFLEVPAHLAVLRKAEREAGTSLHLSQRRVVPWEVRTGFEALHAMYLEQLQAREEQLVQQQQQAVRKRSSSHEKARREREPREHHRHHSRSHRDRGIEGDRNERSSVRMTAVAPLPAPTAPPSNPTEEEGLDSVQERIARIGHKLIAEAFMLPARPRTAEPVSNEV